MFLRTRSALANGLILSLATLTIATAAVAQSTAKPASHGVSSSAASSSTPAAALRQFLVAMVKQDSKTLKAITVPVSDSDFKFLVKGPAPSSSMLKQSLAHFQSISIRAFKPGDQVPLPSGRVKTVTSADVNDDNALLLPDGAPMPTSVHRVHGKWLIDPGPFIAGRKAPKGVQ